MELSATEPAHVPPPTSAAPPVQHSPLASPKPPLPALPTDDPIPIPAAQLPPPAPAAPAPQPPPLLPSLGPTEPRVRTNPPSSAASPRAAMSTPTQMVAQGGMPSDGDAQMLGSVPRSPDSNRPLNVTDALSYLDAVKVQFTEQPDVYNHFLDIMKDFKSQIIDTPGVINRVSMLFRGNPYLIQGFNTFLPPGYRIELSADPRNADTITVTTPSGTVTQNIPAYGAPVRITCEPVITTPAPIVPFPQQPPFGLAPPPVLPVGIGSGSRPPSPTRLAHASELAFAHTTVYSPRTFPPTEAALLGNLGHRGADTIPPGEFNHAIQFLNEIKVRFDDDPETYKQFLEILHAYQKGQKELQDVYAQVQMLFKEAPDLMNEFRDFLPDLAGPSTQPVGLVDILPHPQGGPSAWPQAEAPPPPADKAAKPPARRRKRAPEKDATGQQKNATGRVVKRAKPNQKPEPQSPKFAPFPAPPSPAMPHAHPVMALPQHMQPGHPHMLQPSVMAPGSNGVSMTPPEELLFFDRTKKALESGGTYEEFLKLLNLFAKDVIDTKTLLERAEIFLDGELMTQFKALLGWDDKHGDVEYGPPGSIRTGPPDPYAARPPDDGQGPSYRRLRESEVRLACSGRGQLEWSVLNDEWVSHPTWASEESGFVAHKKNTFEDTLHRSEEERHEYQVHLEGLSRTIAVLEPLDARIEEMSQEERAQFRLKPNLGGTCPGIYERTIKRVYGRDNVAEIMRALHECPSVSVPVVLKRLKQKDEEWRRAQREWSKTWREVDAKNFYKALDHQGIMFKANDKKNITAKHFVQDIEAVKTAQAKARAAEGGPSWARGSLGPQLKHELKDIGILQDSLKLIFSFLDHSQATYSQPERRSVERFLRKFVPVLFMLPIHEFNAACGPLEPGHDDDLADDLAGNDEGEDATKSGRDRNGKRQASLVQSTGISPGDLRKRLLKTAQERSPRTRPKALASKSAARTRSASPAPSDGASTAAHPKGSKLNQEVDGEEDDPPNPADIWIREVADGSASVVGDPPVTRRPFFANTTFYTLLRLLQLLYSRLHMCKEIGAQLAAQKHASLIANPVAVQLGLDESNGPSVVLAQAVEAVGECPSGEEPNVLYMYLLDACDKVFDSELDQATFEEHMRWFFGTKAYQVFTLDKVIIAIVKQVQTIMADNKCQELWELLQRTRGDDTTTIHAVIRYRREAERHVGSDDNLYRFDWDMPSKTLQTQLVGLTDASVEEGRTGIARWKEYVASFVTEYPTEWMPAGRSKGSALFLKRSLMDAAENRDVAEKETGIRIRVCGGTYKLQYEAGTEDVLVRRGEGPARRRLAARQEERRRWLGRQAWAGVGAAA